MFGERMASYNKPLNVPMYTRNIVLLNQTCACGAELSLESSQDANSLVYEWWQNHPCPLREE